MASKLNSLTIKQLLNNLALLPPNSLQKLPHTIIAKADSGASKYFWRDYDKHLLSNIQKILGPPVALPDGTTIRSTEQGNLPLSHLSIKA